MGMNFIHIDVNDMVPQHSATQFLRAYHQELVDKSKKQDGDDIYSGGWSAAPVLEILDIRPLPNRNEAIGYADEHAEKFGPSIAVPYHGTVLRHDEKSKKIFEEIKEASAEIERRHSRTLKEVQSTKSKTKGCPHCGSSINRQYIKFYCDCPVCGFENALMSASQKKFIENAQKKFKMVRKKVRNKISIPGVAYIIAANAAC